MFSVHLRITIGTIFAEMNSPYFFEPFSDISSIQLSEQSVHHAMNVLRMRVGDKLNIVNGKGLLAKCKLSSIQKRDCVIEVLEIHQQEVPVSNLHIAIAFTKNPARIEWFLEKACEIGIHTITPLLCSRSEKTHFKKERFEKILVSAMLQSKQSFLPMLHEPMKLQEVLQLPADIRCIAHCELGQERIALMACIENQKEILILIGPEGDFTSEEIHLCLQQNCKAVTLGNTRLRTETAGLFACCIFNNQIQHHA